MADAGRVIAGRARGIRLGGAGEGTRPMGDRVKQSLFAILEPDLRDARVLDLFAGTGAAGIEALSRGAAHATFVERDREAISVIAANLARTHLAGEHAAVVENTVARWLSLPIREHEPRWDVVIVDPPYDDPPGLLAALTAIGPFVAPTGRVVTKHASLTPPPERVGLLASERVSRFGVTTLTFYRRVEDRPES
jgi:16S rRNA (guanine966-N2)-methyltransferase